MANVARTAPMGPAMVAASLSEEPEPALLPLLLPLTEALGMSTQTLEGQVRQLPCGSKTCWHAWYFEQFMQGVREEQERQAVDEVDEVDGEVDDVDAASRAAMECGRAKGSDLRFCICMARRCGEGARRGATAGAVLLAIVGEVC